MGPLVPPASKICNSVASLLSAFAAYKPSTIRKTSPLITLKHFVLRLTETGHRWRTSFLSRVITSTPHSLCLEEVLQRFHTIRRWIQICLTENLWSVRVNYENRFVCLLPYRLWMLVLVSWQDQTDGLLLFHSRCNHPPSTSPASPACDWFSSPCATTKSLFSSMKDKVSTTSLHTTPSWIFEENIEVDDIIRAKVLVRWSYWNLLGLLLFLSTKPPSYFYLERTHTLTLPDTQPNRLKLTQNHFCLCDSETLMII